MSTVAALLASFFAGQQTFCFLQLQGEAAVVSAVNGGCGGGGESGNKEGGGGGGGSDSNNNRLGSSAKSGFVGRLDEDDLLTTVRRNFSRVKRIAISQNLCDVFRC